MQVNVLRFSVICPALTVWSDHEALFNYQFTDVLTKKHRFSSKISLKSIKMLQNTATTIKVTRYCIFSFFS